MIEVEVKAKVDGFESVMSKMDEIGAFKVKTERQEDTYFNAPHRDFAETDEALRIRKIPSEKDTHIFITYKGSKIDSSSKTRQEFEVEVENDEITAHIFESLGFRPVQTVVKDRDIYHMNDFVITLDNVHQVGTYVEIEKDLDDGEDFQKALDEIFEIYSQIGITDGFERRSYLELLGV